MIAAAVYGELVDTLGTHRFDAGLFDAVRGLGVAELFGYSTDGVAPPVVIVTGGFKPSATSRTRRYVDEFFTLDPVLHVAKGVAETSMCRVAREDIPAGPYRDECFGWPRFAGKVSFVQHRRQRRHVLSLYFGSAANLASAARLAPLAEAALPLLRRHGELIAVDHDRPLTARLERRIAVHYPDLSGRERAVCARTIAGMTSAAIGRELGIGGSSVITYRRRAYLRANVSAAGQMLSRLLD